MKITSISIYKQELPLTKPYWLSGGRLKFERLDSTIVEIQTDEGISGWGEACPWGHSYLPAHGGGVRAAIRLLAGSLIGEDPCALQARNAQMDEVLPGHLSAKSAIDMACWDILGKKVDMPLWRLMGTEHPDGVSINSSISTGSAEAMAKDLRRAHEQGCTMHSAKIGGLNAADEVARIQLLCEALPVGDDLTFDINRAWTPGEAISILNSVDMQHWVEQPCQTLDQCLLVRQNTRQPMVLDECLYDEEQHLLAWKLGVCQGVKIKPNRVGGLTKALFLRDFGTKIGWQMHIEDVGGSVMADTAAMHLASSTPRRFRLASWLCHMHLAHDPFPGQGVRNVRGKAVPPSLPGLGVRPERDALGVPEAIFQ